MKKYDLTRYKVTKLTGVTASTLQYTNGLDDVSKLQVKTLMVLAEAVGLTPGEVLNEMIELESDRTK
ncbi:hypothetical protein IV38_GL001974 [Lactobacillus selangorensis]|uniref:HTH cro/C1-type domain-containing protein n=1 Tax=Lactobacillus selangorensis TaxID=81857 RepID=A0A0R2FGK1_9LACO|nr:hypothetical protein IV38_GL001974 [Lactobacillus selangorensis]KRN30276.1 hypothetical protein IV40_GL001863 [Lactobacillus selangorensis]